MQNPDRFTEAWRAIIGKHIVVHPALRWLLPGLMMIVTLILGLMPVAIQAQIAEGRSVGAHFALSVDASNPLLNHLCVGESVSLPITVSLQSVEFIGEGSTGSVVVHSANTTAVVGDSTIAHADQGGLMTQEAPFVTSVFLTGLKPGRTTITINATVTGTVARYLTPEVGLPIPITDRADPVTVPIRVIFCEYRLDVHTLWGTSMHGAFTVLIANAQNLDLTGDRSENTLRFTPPIDGVPYMHWTWANNRIIGCRVSSGRFRTQAPTVRAVIRETDDIAVTITYRQYVPGDANSEYYQNLCLPHHVGPCSQRPDGHCFTMPVAIPYDWFEPQTIEIIFPMNGDSLTTTHRIRHSWGAADGNAVITLTPVRQ